MKHPATGVASHATSGPAAGARAVPPPRPAAGDRSFAELLKRAQPQRVTWTAPTARHPPADRSTKRTSGAPSEPREKMDARSKPPEREPGAAPVAAIGAQAAIVSLSQAIICESPVPVAGSAPAHAELAALAERWVTSLRVGRVGATGHRLDMALRGRHGEELSVRLELSDGELSASITPDASSVDTAQQIAAALRTELSTRGVALGAVDIERGGSHTRVP